jgi:hypothetical protein
MFERVEFLVDDEQQMTLYQPHLSLFGDSTETTTCWSGRDLAGNNASQSYHFL